MTVRVRESGEAGREVEGVTEAGSVLDLFQESAASLCAATDQLRNLVHEYEDVEAKARRIAEREHESEITHAIIRLINTTFVTRWIARISTSSRPRWTT